MNDRFFASTCAVTTVVIVAFLAQGLAVGQQAGNWTQTRTPWGDPDLQGVYTFSTNTPFQRPAALADKNLTPAELAALDDRRTADLEADVIDAPEGSLGPSYNFFWESSEKGTLAGRIQLIVNPEDGLMPPMTPQAQKGRADRAAEAASMRVGTPPFVHTLINRWDDHPSYTRCISRPMPRFGQEYNHGLQVLQTPGQVVIHYESMHDVRVIPLDGRPHLDPNIGQYNGDSRGHWEGDTLVVDWTNFTNKQLVTLFGSVPQGNMRMTERFTKINEHTINYEVTVDDPTTWTSPFTFIVPWRSDDPNYQEPEDLYEFACHEGNYRMMEDSLSGTKALKQALPAK